MYNTPHSFAMRSFLSIDFRRYVATRLCKRSPVRKRTLSTYLCWTNNKPIYIVRMRFKKHKNTDKSIRIVHRSDLSNCFLMKCNKQQERYCVSKAKIFTLGDIELNLGPVNAYMLLQSRLAQHALSILDVGGSRDCLFRVISHQLYQW